MPKSDDLKNRIDELFSNLHVLESPNYPHVNKALPTGYLQAEVKDIEEILCDLVRESVIGMAIISNDGSLLQVNTAFCELFGYQEAEYGGRYFQQFIFEEDLPGFNEVMHTMNSGSANSDRIQIRCVHLSGGLVWIDLSLSLIKDAMELPRCYLAIVTDIAPQKQIDKLLEQQLSDLNLLEDLGRKIGERPSKEELFAWTCERISMGREDANDCRVMIQFQDRLFGDSEALAQKFKYEELLRIANFTQGKIIIGYNSENHNNEQFLLQRISDQLNGYLETQNALEEARSTRRFLENLIDAIHDPIFVKDEKHRWVVANTSFEQILGLPQEDFLGKSDYDLLPKEQADVFWEKDDLVLSTEETNVNEEVILWGGELRDISTVKSVFKDPNTGNKYIVGTIRDITERKRNEELASKRAAQLATVAELSTTIAQTLDPQELLQRVVNLTKEKFDLYHAHIYLLDETGENLRLSAGAFEIGATMVAQGWQIPLEQEQSLVARAARERFGVIVNDVHHDAGFLANPLLPNTRSEMAIPLLVVDRLLGVLDVQSDTPNHFTEEDVNIMNALAAQVSVALENARQYHQLQQAFQTAEMLYTSSAKIAAATSPMEVLNVLLESTDLSEFEYANILLFDSPWIEEMPSYSKVVASRDQTGRNQISDLGLAIDMADPRLMQLFQKERFGLIDNLFSGSSTGSLIFPFYSGAAQYFATFPLWAGNSCIGIVLGISSQMIEISPEEQRRIASLVDHAATVLESQRLQEEMEARLRELVALQRYMSREAWASYQTQAAGDIVGYLLDDGRIRPVTKDAVPMLERIAAGDGAFVTPETMAYSVTLSVRGEPIGFFGIKQDDGRSLSEEDIQFLEAVSEQVAQALERARLMEQTQKSAVELQAVAEVSTATSTILEPTSLLQKVVDLTKERFGLYHAHIYLLDQEKKSLQLAAGAGKVGQQMMLESWSISVDREDSIVARTARTQQGQIVIDVTQEPRFMFNPLLPETRSELAVPIIVGEELLGVFDVQANIAGRFSYDDVRTFSTLASQIGVALQNAKLYTEQLITVERLRELDNMKSAFLANMSHELRTPLNSILGFTQVMLEGLDGPLTDLMTNDLELIEKNGKHLLNLINDVLDLARIEAGRLTLSPEPTNLYTLLNDVILSSTALVGEKDLEIKLIADAEQDWTIELDQIRMRQIFINLIGNAIKFTESGGVYVEMEKIWDVEKGREDRLQVRIRDTGVGIPSNKLEEIFEAFSQVDSSTTRKVGGTGLGLPISRRLVEMHGGRLWAESPGPGLGSTFYLELPIEIEQEMST